MARSLALAATLVGAAACENPNPIYQLWFNNDSGETMIASIVGTFGDEHRVLATYRVPTTPGVFGIDVIRERALEEHPDVLRLVIFDRACRHVESNELVAGNFLVTLEEDDAIRLTRSPVELDDDGNLSGAPPMCELPEGWPFVL